MKPFLLSIALSAIAVSASAQTSNIPSVLKAPLSQGLKVHKSFDGPSGLTGWVLTRGGAEPVIVFTTSDGKTLLSGAVIDDSGRNLVEAYIDIHAPKEDLSAFVPSLDKAPFAVQGDAKGGRVVYAFFDSTCPYCNVAYDALKAELKPGTQVRWIPVAFLQPKSAGQAAAILGAPNPAAALQKHEESFRSGGIDSAEVTPEMKRRLDDNLKLFREMGFKGVPAIIYRGSDGRWSAVKGAPQRRDIAKVIGN